MSGFSLTLKVMLTLHFMHIKFINLNHYNNSLSQFRFLSPFCFLHRFSSMGRVDPDLNSPSSVELLIVSSFRSIF